MSDPDPEVLTFGYFLENTLLASVLFFTQIFDSYLLQQADFKTFTEP